jgi:hypothetical protein
MLAASSNTINAPVKRLDEVLGDTEIDLFENRCRSSRAKRIKQICTNRTNPV